jgi:hypothetical protein
LHTIKKDYTDQKIESVEKIKLIKEKLKLLSLQPHIEILVKRIEKLNERGNNNYKTFVDSLKELENEIVDHLRENIDKSFILNGGNIDEVLESLKNVEQYVDDLGDQIDGFGDNQFYTQVKDIVEQETDGYNLAR